MCEFLRKLTFSDTIDFIQMLIAFASAYFLWRTFKSQKDLAEIDKKSKVSDFFPNILYIPEVKSQTPNHITINLKIQSTDKQFVVDDIKYSHPKKEYFKVEASQNYVGRIFGKLDEFKYKITYNGLKLKEVTKTEEDKILNISFYYSDLIGHKYHQRIFFVATKMFMEPLEKIN